MVPRLVFVSVAFITLTAVRHPAAAESEAAACLRYEPDTVQISGVLRRHTYPGPPNYESIRAGDAPESGYYLHLRRTVCASREYASDDDVDPAAQRRVEARVVQLVLDSAGYARLRAKLGQQVTLRGTLFSAYTGHHHAPLLMVVVFAGARR